MLYDAQGHEICTTPLVETTSKKKALKCDLTNVDPEAATERALAKAVVEGKSDVVITASDKPIHLNATRRNRKYFRVEAPKASTKITLIDTLDMERTSGTHPIVYLFAAIGGWLYGIIFLLGTIMPNVVYGLDDCCEKHRYQSFIGILLANAVFWLAGYVWDMAQIWYCPMVIIGAIQLIQFAIWWIYRTILGVLDIEPRQNNIYLITCFMINLTISALTIIATVFYAINIWQIFY